MTLIVALVLGTLLAQLVGWLGVDYVGSWPQAVAVELVGAAGLLYPPTRVAAAVCLFVLMVAMFPANVYAARMPNPPKSMTSRLACARSRRSCF
jgi:hypothetical protein